MQDFLPIGSVVLLKNCTKKLMVIGFISSLTDSDEIFDYSGCMYPEGLLDSSQTYLFNKDQIDMVFNYGYVDEEQINFMKELNKEALRVKPDETSIEIFNI